jgi:hypothetical protein
MIFYLPVSLIFALLLFSLVKHILGQRDHITIDKTLGTVFTKLFSFDHVGVLFVDGVENPAIL